jgi:putative sterol carrier protein
MSNIAQQIADGMQAVVNPTETIDGVIKVDMGADGIILIDGRTAPARVTVGDGPADCTMTCSAETYAGLLDGSVNGMKAYMCGKLKMSGKDALVDKMDTLFKA